MKYNNPNLWGIVKAIYAVVIQAYLRKPANKQKSQET